MNNLKLVITEDVYSDMDIISGYIGKDDVNAAKNFIKDLFGIFDTLVKFPNIGVHKRGIKDKNVKIYIHKKRYLVVYKVGKDHLVILKVSNSYTDIYNILAYL